MLNGSFFETRASGIVLFSSEDPAAMIRTERRTSGSFLSQVAKVLRNIQHVSQELCAMICRSVQGTSRITLNQENSDVKKYRKLGCERIRKFNNLQHSKSVPLNSVKDFVKLHQTYEVATN